MAKVIHQQDVNKAPDKDLLPVVSLSCLHGRQLHRATSIVRGSQYNAQQLPRAAGLLTGETLSLLLFRQTPVAQQVV